MLRLPSHLNAWSYGTAKKREKNSLLKMPLR
jgi:hypothetical protein